MHQTEKDWDVIALKSCRILKLDAMLSVRLW